MRQEILCNSSKIIKQYEQYVTMLETMNAELEVSAFNSVHRYFINRPVLYKNNEYKIQNVFRDEESTIIFLLYNNIYVDYTEVTFI